MQTRYLQYSILGLALALLVSILVNWPLWLLILLLVLLLLLILLLLFGSWEPGGDQTDYPPEEFFIQDQVIVRGPAAEVEAIIQQIGGTVSLQLERRLAFGDLSQALQDCLDPCYDVNIADWVLDLYRLTGTEQDVAAVIQAINQQAGPGGTVSAEPNWVSGHPWEPAGSPWEPAGSPWEPAGSGSPMSGAQDADPAFFMQQWAWNNIDLPAGSNRLMGQGLRIGVFDTSPFGEVGATVPAAQSVDWVTEPKPLHLTVKRYALPGDGATAVASQRDLSSHGLFSAGIAHALAPDADIHLIRVLGDDNKGDLFTLLLALFEFIQANLPENRPVEIMGVVINWSLGIRIPPDEADFGLPREVLSMQDLLRAARCLGMMVVAAAGNDSANLDRPEPANLPANWPSVFGVAASTQANGRSCFSNRGNIAAPGGNGRPGGPNEHRCVPANQNCTSPKCPYSVVGPVMKTGKNSGFIYWSGSSFATPMVAGLAALVMERGGGRLLPGDVRRIIECAATKVGDADLGAGIINVARTLAQFEECAAKLGIELSPPAKAS
ncbi:MAG: S8/S53 family peptidase [Ardenticatenaceae bacterium]|nr:S8/S53 family peptidase [Ardenticatenaceae bacterium]MCB9442673.1 S8/S53 family peptidase [Ardenticatenaceae bacterium]